MVLIKFFLRNTKGENDPILGLPFYPQTLWKGVSEGFQGIIDPGSITRELFTIRGGKQEWKT